MEKLHFKNLCYGHSDEKIIFAIYYPLAKKHNYAIKSGTPTMTNSRNKEMWWAYIRGVLYSELYGISVGTLHIIIVGG